VRLRCGVVVCFCCARCPSLPLQTLHAADAAAAAFYNSTPLLLRLGYYRRQPIIIMFLNLPD
jgi:hypothetical protein